MIIWVPWIFYKVVTTQESKIDVVRLQKMIYTPLRDKYLEYAVLLTEGRPQFIKGEKPPGKRICRTNT